MSTSDSRSRRCGEDVSKDVDGSPDCDKLLYVGECEGTVGGECPVCGRILFTDENQITDIGLALVFDSPLRCQCGRDFRGIDMAGKARRKSAPPTSLTSESGQSASEAVCRQSAEPAQSRPRPGSATTANAGCLVALACVLLLLWQAIPSCGSPSTTGPKKTLEEELADTPITVFTLAKFAVKERLSNPRSAKFADMLFHSNETGYKIKGDLARAWGWVEAENLFGATVRQKWIVIERRDKSERYGWRIVSVVFE